MNRIEFDAIVARVKTLLAEEKFDQAAAKFNDSMPRTVPCADGENITSILAEVEVQKGKYIDRICPVLAAKYRAYCDKELSKLDTRSVSQADLTSLQEFVVRSYRQVLDEVADARKISSFEKSDLTIHASTMLGQKDLISWSSVRETYGLYGEVLAQLKKHRDILLAFEHFEDGERIVREKPGKTEENEEL